MAINKIQQLRGELDKAISRNTLTPKQLAQFLGILIETVKNHKEGLSSLVDETSRENLRKIQEAIQIISEKHFDALKEVRGLTTKQTKEFEEKFKKVQDTLLELQSIEVPEVDEEGIISKALKRIPKPVVLETPEQIRDKLSSLKKDERLDKKAIKGLENITEKSDLDRAIAILDQRSQFLIKKGVKHDSTLSGSGTDADPLRVIGGEGGGHTIQDEGISLTQRTNLNFVGAGVTVTDDSGNDATVVTVGGGSGTVTDFVFTDGSGFNGTVADSTTTPTLALTTTLATKSVVFIGASGALVEDNSNFQYDTSLGYLGIGTAPASRLDVRETVSGFTGNFHSVQFLRQNGTFVTTGGLRTNIGLQIANQGSRASGANALTNVGLYVTATNAQNNYSIQYGGDIMADADNTYDIGGAGILRPRTGYFGTSVVTPAITVATSITGSYLTASEILITDGSKNIVSAPVATYPSLTELTYVKGVTSALQTQLNAKATSSGALTQFVGNGNWKVWYSDGSGDVQEISLGADGTFLKSNGAAVAPSFATPAGSGDVTKVGTPVNNQVGVWTGDGTLEGDVALTFDTSTNTLTTGTLDTIDVNLSGTLYIDNIDIYTGANPAITFQVPITIPDEAYGAGWNGNLEVPTKNALYDKIETLGGGSGITRTQITTSGSFTLGTTASTDYIYYVAGAHTLSMPSPNNNRYTVKNNHSANITIDTAGAELIEGVSSISIAPGESVDITSDTTNWFVV